MHHITFDPTHVAVRSALAHARRAERGDVRTADEIHARLAELYADAGASDAEVEAEEQAAADAQWAAPSEAA